LAQAILAQDALSQGLPLHSSRSLVRWPFSCNG